jgi:hypothetical protein
VKTLQPNLSASAKTLSVSMSLAGFAELYAAAKAFALDDRKVIERSGNEERAALIITVGALRRLHDALDLCAILPAGPAGATAEQALSSPSTEAKDDPR